MDLGTPLRGSSLPLSAPPGRLFSFRAILFSFTQFPSLEIHCCRQRFPLTVANLELTWGRVGKKVSGHGFHPSLCLDSRGTTALRRGQWTPSINDRVLLRAMGPISDSKEGGRTCLDINYSWNSQHISVRPRLPQLGQAWALTALSPTPSHSHTKSPFHRGTMGNNYPLSLRK